MGASSMLTRVAVVGLALLVVSELKAQGPAPGAPAINMYNNNLRVPPNFGNQSPGTWGAVQAGAQAGYARGLQNGAANAYANGYNPYGYGYNETPVGGYMQGTASIINAQGEWMNQIQQAEITKEQSKQAKIDTKRKAFDEWRYEQENTPTFEEVRQKQLQQALLRSLNNPPQSEIWSGQALNTILVDIQRHGGAREQGPMIPLSAQVIDKINVTGGAGSGGGNLGVFKNGGKLDWPLVFRSDDYSEPRQQLNQLAPQAVQMAQTGKFDGDMIQQMSDAVAALRQKMKDNVASIDANQYMRGLRYLDDLKNGLRALQDPNVASLFPQNWSAGCQDVTSLIAAMSRQGLRFAPASPGGEPAYNAVHQGLVTYDTQVASLTSQ